MTTSNRTNSTGNARRSAGTPRVRRGRMAVAVQPGEVNYKDAAQMRRVINERGKIGSTRRTGASAKLQRELSIAVKRARHLALIPMAPNHVHVTELVQDPAQRTQVVGTSSEGQSEQSNEEQAQKSDEEQKAPEATAETAAADEATDPDSAAETVEPEAVDETAVSEAVETEQSIDESEDESQKSE